MSTQQRAPYETKAKDTVLCSKPAERYTSYGQPISQLERQQKTEEEKKHEMEREINEVVAEAFLNNSEYWRLCCADFFPHLVTKQTKKLNCAEARMPFMKNAREVRGTRSISVLSFVPSNCPIQYEIHPFHTNVVFLLKSTFHNSMLYSNLFCTWSEPTNRRFYGAKFNLFEYWI